KCGRRRCASKRADHGLCHSPMLGRFWLFLMLVFRILILGTVATDMFEDEQQEFICNTAQPGCKQVCYDMAFPISQYRFWVFHIVLIATPSLLFLLYATHHHSKRANHSDSCLRSSKNFREEKRFKRFYIINLLFRIGAEVGFIVGQWKLYGFEVKAHFECERFPCPKIVDCFTSRPAEKTIFLHFYFSVGVLSAFISFLELCYCTVKWFCYTQRRSTSPDSCTCEKILNCSQEDHEEEKDTKKTFVRAKRGSVRASEKTKPHLAAPPAPPWCLSF
uniref:Gap junction protein delta 3 n=1 Tax=Oryzias latipes TaxID=8090 RepID=A0A3P9JME0_ORYLA